MLNATIEAVWRIESPRLIASLTRMLRDVGRAEELAADAFVAALAQWPDEGIPRNPAAWLMTTAKRRAIDELRRSENLQHKTAELERSTDVASFDDEFATVLDDIDDDVLRLMFFSCHPVLGTEARVALTLRLLGGLTALEIARAFVVPEATIAQRIVRAKRTLTQARVPFEIPTGAERNERLGSVLEVIYLIFNEGYCASAGDDILRPELVEDALRLGRVLAALMPYESEAHGLVALMELQASRFRARVDPAGNPVLLQQQDRGRWNRLLIQRGLASLERARLLDAKLGPYALQASIAAVHATAATFADTQWSRIVEIYDALAELQPTPVVALNRAVAVGMAHGPQAGLALVDELAGVAALAKYHLLPAVRGDLLLKLARYDEAQVAFERAADLASNARDRVFLLSRARECETQRV